MDKELYNMIQLCVDLVHVLFVSFEKGSLKKGPLELNFSDSAEIEANQTRDELITAAKTAITRV